MGRTDPLRELFARAVTLLPLPEWEAAVRAAIREGDIDVVPAILDRGPAALSEGMSAAVLDGLARISRGSRSDRQDLAPSRLLDRLGDRFEPSEDAAASAAAILARLPEDADERRLRDTVLVLIFDLYEGGVEEGLLARAQRLVASGVQMVVLPALSDEGAPSDDRALTARLAALGVPAFARTLDLFPDLMAATIRRSDLTRWTAGAGIAAVAADGKG